VFGGPAVAANFVPSEEDAIDVQSAYGLDVRSIHVTPESELVCILPVLLNAVTNFVPSVEDAIGRHTPPNQVIG
jgi:hypothetical protein